MVVLRFNDENVWRCCCDRAHMRRQWGPARTRQISHRLQQLEAMASVADLSFLPLESRTVGNQIEVDVDDELVLVLDTSTPRQGELMVTVVVRSLTMRVTKAVQ